jgi:outer membrane murein-binding lipoprotein Lpp
MKESREVDISPYIGTIATVVIAFLGFYGAITARLTRMETKMDDLASQVDKHNNVIERTFKLESDMNTAYKRIDELKARDEKIEERMEKFHG